MAVFKAEGDHWSFGKPNPQKPSEAIEIAEKKRISSLASIGLYGFRNMQQFQTIAEWQLKHGEPVRGEHYIAPMLQTMID